MARTLEMVIWAMTMIRSVWSIRKKVYMHRTVFLEPGQA
jgi:hypothetical protein